MKKTVEQLEAYRIARQELQNTLSGDAKKDCQIYNDLWYLDFMEKGGIISEDGGFFTDSEELIKKVKTRYQNDIMTAWWTKQKNRTVKNGVNGFLDEQIKKWLEEMYLPYIDETQIVGDLACASGQWSFLIAKKAKQVYAFDYSKSMIDFAKDKAEKLNINNIEFVQADAITLKFDRQYDNFMMLGLLTYINNEEEAEHIIRNVYEALKQGARLIVRDSLTKTDYREIFLYNFISGYQAVYRNVECYRELFVRCGFEIESEIALKEEVTDGIEYVNYGAILKKA